MTDEMRGLIERIEGASGPCRVLDGDIACAIGLLHPRDFVTPTSSVPPAPEYTASNDTAMALVPEGWRIQLSDWDDETLRAHGPWQCILTPPGKRSAFDEWWPRCDHAASAPLALCAASLRALSTMGVKGDG
jgi:hypothetical protein